MFGRIIRAPGICAQCGTSEFIQCAHLWSRSYRAVRWDTRNAVPLCRKCHVYYTHRPIEWDQWMLAWWGLELYTEMRMLALTHRSPDLPELLESLRVLEKQITQ